MNRDSTLLVSKHLRSDTIEKLPNNTKKKTQSQLWKNYTKSNGHVPIDYDNDSDLGSDIDLREQKINIQKAYPDTSLTYIAPTESLKVYNVSDDITKRMQESVGKCVHDMNAKLPVSKRPGYLQEKYSTTKRVSSVLQTPESGYQSDFTPVPMTDLSYQSPLSPLFQEEKLGKSDTFIMNVFMELNQLRQAKGLRPFSLSNTFDGLAGEVVKDIKEGGINNIPSGIWRNKLTRHYVEVTRCKDESNIMRSNTEEIKSAL
ncbi:hypothetical protein ACTXT7_006185 [Hymenolepis weldensis]